MQDASLASNHSPCVSFPLVVTRDSSDPVEPEDCMYEKAQDLNM